MVRPSNPSRVYLDSNTLILAVTKRPGYEPVASVLSLAQAGRVELFTSALSYVEVRGQGRKDPYDADLDQRVLALLDSPRLVKIDFYRGLAIRARRYAQTYGFHNYDAVHLASAVEAGVDVLMSYDQDFDKVTSVDGVWVDRPYEPGDPTLFPPV